MQPPSYQDLQDFFVKRQFLVRYDRALLSPEEYQQLKDRVLLLPKERLDYLTGFMNGWKRAKE